MLESLSIKDFALIDSVTVEFGRGFTILSGETGAGKSILIGALSFLLGGKADAASIRSGGHEAQVSGIFLLDTAAAFIRPDFSADTEEEIRTAGEWLFRHGIAPEDGRVLIRRSIRDNGRSTAWIQQAAVTRADLAAFSAFLLDIHGQHEHQSLMRVASHRTFLDARAGIVPEVHAFTALYAELVETREHLAELSASNREQEELLERYRYAVSEIAAAQ
ncbi:MAG: AAA family ATPase, partial [Treponema sp.]|nr:AAA family ATPase [Treponema sp.]